MFETNKRKEEKFNDYKGFVEKYKTKKTTDDCYTPPDVYEVIKEFVVKEYKVDENKIVRPFYPGGDYKNFNYGDDNVVVDNPPFSILKEIKDFYCKNNIKFFLFAPHLTLFSGSDHKSICYIISACNIIYHNKAKVNTSFVTNLDKYRIRTVPELKNKIAEIQKTNVKKRPKYKYPKIVISSAILSKYIDAGLSINFSEDELHFVRRLDSQKEYKKSIYGAGYLISSKKAEELKAEELKAEEDLIEWKLSDREREIIQNLS